MTRDAVSQHQDVSPPQEVHRFRRREVAEARVRPVVRRNAVHAAPFDPVRERAKGRVRVRRGGGADGTEKEIWTHPSEAWYSSPGQEQFETHFRTLAMPIELACNAYFGGGWRRRARVETWVVGASGDRPEDLLKFEKPVR